MQPQQVNSENEQMPTNQSAMATSTDTSQPNSLEIPQLNLPKGGGGIKGIEEKFQVNAITGTASLAIPIPLSPARLAPSLGLSYNSGAGNSPFGLGWSLSTPSIRRKTEKNLPNYEDSTESDTFVFSGVEDLVRVLEKQGTDWKRSTHQKSEDGSDFTVKAYRPRIEGMFARIEHWTNKQTNETHWRTVSKNNIHSYYGLSDESRICDPNEAKKVFEWLLCKTHDDKGNITLYRYKKEDFAGIDNKLNEKNRKNTCTQTYLRKVVYGNKKPYYLGDAIPEENAFMFTVLFDYGEHAITEAIPKDIHEEKTAWACRKDPFSTYRSGFEIRTYRRCSRVLVFHSFDELPHGPYLVKSVQFAYDDSLRLTGNAQIINGFSYLVRARQNGHLWDEQANSYQTQFLPELEIAYQQHEWNTAVQEVSPDNVANAPAGLSTRLYTWIDLFNEGLAGILTEQAGEWHYKSNLGNGTFANAFVVAPKPSFKGLNTKLSIQALEGNGINYLVQAENEPRGFFKFSEEDQWEPMRTFDQFPVLDSRNVRKLDLNADGRADLLVSSENSFQWYESIGEKGFTLKQQIVKEVDEEKGPTILFEDRAQSIFLADMSGDGLTDIVRIRNSEICYWPNLGYGRFGAKVSMDNAPVFDHPDVFNPAMLRLADIDGSGTTDVIYLGKNEFRVWMNLSGNEWTVGPQRIQAFPAIHSLADVAVLDFLGTGTACIVYSSPIAQIPMQYIDLMGSKKPHILAGYLNNCGKEVSLAYKPSTFFYLNDKKQGNKWITKLPFPIHCVASIRSEDKIRETVFTSSYSYRHGYFDFVEREFRGFARVEQLDTEEFERFKLNEAKNVVEESLHQPPVRTVSWFHTGAFLQKDRILHQCEGEYFQNTFFPEYPFPQPVVPDNLSTDELSEALRACKGVPLRSEVYADDKTDRSQFPYSVSQLVYDIRLVQPRGENRYASFQVIPAESIGYGYDRNPADPHIRQSFILETDELGNITKSASVIYPRVARPANTPDKVWEEQRKLHISYGEALFTNDVITDRNYRLRTGYESKNYEVAGIDQPVGFYFTKGVIKTQIQTATQILFEEEFTGGVQKRLLGQQRIYFKKDDFSGPLPLGELSSLGIMHKSHKLAFTQGLITQHYGSKVTTSMLEAAKYIHSEGDAHWWAPSGDYIYPNDPKSTFYTPIGARDLFGNESVVEYDAYTLLTKSTTDAIGNKTSATNDYRTLTPVLLTDPNLNRVTVETDALGMVIKSAVMGKAGSNDGDTLADPTTRLEYDLFNWKNNGKPNFAHAFTREKHGAANPRWQESYVYSDGGGEVIMTKSQVKPGKAKRWNPATKKVDEVDANPRWLGNGRTILNNKGKVIKQYDPYFSTTSDYETEDALVETGMSPVLYYDPVGRNIQTELPNGTFTKVEFDAWQVSSYDVNDTVKDSQWYADRGSPDPASSEPADPEQRAAWLAAQHHNTPSTAYSDSLGRAFYAISDYGAGKTTAVFLLSDMAGRYTQSFDQLERLVSENYVNLLGQGIHGKSAEKGESWVFVDAMGRLVRTWDNSIREFYSTFDVLHRPVSTFVEEGSNVTLFGHMVYGDLLPDAEAISRNLKGKTYQLFDQTGQTILKTVDFKGNVTEVERRLTKDYTQVIDWQSVEGLGTLNDIQTAADLLLESEVFTSSATLDALARPITVTLPDHSVIQPSYGEGNELNSLKVQIRGAGDFIDFLRSQDYDAKGQRQVAEFGNGTITNYFYDPATFRLDRLLTRQTAADAENKSLQDLNFTFDPVGNVTQIRDNAQQTHFFANAVVSPENTYVYDATYQLRMATGREHAGLGRDHNDSPFIDQLPHLNNADAVVTYTENYEYDVCGNIKKLQHRATNTNWTQRYQYAYDLDPTNRTNRLNATSAIGDADGVFSNTYTYDLHGNMTKMPHLSELAWNFMDQLKSVDLGGGGKAYYTYGLGGNRIRKVIERIGGKILERIYLGAVEIYRERQGTNAPDLERYTLHISDNAGRIAQVDTKTIDTANSDPANQLNQPNIRYQYSNHLGSATLETDEAGNVISYEEYHPFGTSAYRVSKPGNDFSLKRYRYCGKERDDETGFYCMGVRYYAAWLGRWTSSDPAGFVDGFNLYRYCHNNPVMLTDPNGTDVSWQAAPPEMQTPGEEGRQKAIDFLNSHYIIGTENGTRYRVRVNVSQVTWIDVPAGQGVSYWQGRDYDIISVDRIDPSDTNQPEDNTFEPINGSDQHTEDDATGDGDAQQPSGDGEGGSTNDESTLPTDGADSTSVSGQGGDGVTLPNNPGASAVSTYDSVQRGRYTDANKIASQAARDAVAEARQGQRAVDAWEAAREASEGRNVRRIQTQQRLSPGGRAMSQAVDEGRSFASSVEEYMQRAPGRRTPAPTRYAYEIADRVAEGAGRSNRIMTGLSRFGRVAGPIALAYGLYVGARNIYNAPEGERGRVIGEEVGNFAGGAVGFSMGMSAGVALAGGVSAALVALGVISGPIGWLAIGLGLAIGALGAWAFGSVFSKIGGWIGSWFD